MCWYLVMVKIIFEVECSIIVKNFTEPGPTPELTLCIHQGPPLYPGTKITQCYGPQLQIIFHTYHLFVSVSVCEQVHVCHPMFVAMMIGQLAGVSSLFPPCGS